MYRNERQLFAKLLWNLGTRLLCECIGLLTFSLHGILIKLFIKRTPVLHHGDALQKKTSQKELFPAGLEPATFRVLGGCDNHYTTETTLRLTREIFNFSFDSPLSTNRGKSLLFFLLLLVGIVIT